MNEWYILTCCIFLPLVVGLLVYAATGKNPVEMVAAWVGNRIADVFCGRVPGGRK